VGKKKKPPQEEFWRNTPEEGRIGKDGLSGFPRVRKKRVTPKVLPHSEKRHLPQEGEA